MISHKQFLKILLLLLLRGRNLSSRFMLESLRPTYVKEAIFPLPLIASWYPILVQSPERSGEDSAVTSLLLVTSLSFSLFCVSLFSLFPTHCFSHSSSSILRPGFKFGQYHLLDVWRVDAILLGLGALICKMGVVTAQRHKVTGVIKCINKSRKVWSHTPVWACVHMHVCLCLHLCA